MINDNKCELKRNVKLFLHIFNHNADDFAETTLNISKVDYSCVSYNVWNSKQSFQKNRYHCALSYLQLLQLILVHAIREMVLKIVKLLNVNIRIS